MHRFNRCKASENASEMYLDSSVTLETSLLNRLRVAATRYSRGGTLSRERTAHRISAVTTPTEQPQRIEDATIQPIPDADRHGKARDLFTIWFGSNIMMLTIVTGALATTVFSQPFWPAVVAIVIGNLVGAIFMALHSAQGPRLGVPQMVQTRGQFGSYGSLLVICIVIIMYVGFLASSMVLGGEALASLALGWSEAAGIVLVGVLSVIATIYGHDLIHAYARMVTYVAGLKL